MCKADPTNVEGWKEVCPHVPQSKLYNLSLAVSQVFLFVSRRSLRSLEGLRVQSKAQKVGKRQPNRMKRIRRHLVDILLEYEMNRWSVCFASDNCWGDGACYPVFFVRGLISMYSFSDFILTFLRSNSTRFPENNGL